MKTMKIWRKSRLSERHANLFADGRMGAINVCLKSLFVPLLELEGEKML